MISIIIYLALGSSCLLVLRHLYLTKSNTHTDEEELKKLKLDNPVEVAWLTNGIDFATAIGVINMILRQQLIPSKSKTKLLFKDNPFYADNCSPHSDVIYRYLHHNGKKAKIKRNTFYAKSIVASKILNKEVLASLTSFRTKAQELGLRTSNKDINDTLYFRFIGLFFQITLALFLSMFISSLGGALFLFLLCGLACVLNNSVLKISPVSNKGQEIIKQKRKETAKYKSSQYTEEAYPDEKLLYYAWRDKNVIWRYSYLLK